MARAAREESLPPGVAALAWANTQHERLLASPQGGGAMHVPVGLLTVNDLLCHFVEGQVAGAGPDDNWVRAITEELHCDECVGCRFQARWGS